MKTVSRSAGAARKHFYALLLSCACALVVWVSITAPIYQYYDSLNNLFFQWVRQLPLPSSPGFSDSGKLGTIHYTRNSAIENEVAVRVFSKTAPGYLRGRVGVTYGNGRWTNGTRETEYSPDRGGEKSKTMGRYVLPGRPEPGVLEAAVMVAYPTARYRAHFFLPLAASAVDTASQRVMLMPGNALKTKYASTSKGYFVFTDPAPVFDVVDALSRQPAATPDGVDARLIDVGGIPPSKTMQAALQETFRRMQRLFLLPGDEAALRALPLQQKIEAIRRYFSKEYMYKIGIHLDPKNPLWDFLVNKRHGHCELFASAGVLLLRKLGVPARYVTGFVCEEKNSYAELWVARNRHAHAWVEYFDTQAGWRVAEFTPANGLPQTEASEDADALYSYLAAQWERFVGFLKREGLGGIFAYVLEYLGTAGNWVLESWWRLAMAVFLFGLFFYYRLFQRRRRRKAVYLPPREFPTDLAAQRERFFVLEKELRKKRLGKRDAETLEEYAARIETYGGDLDERETVVRFLRQYAAARYAPFDSE